MRPFRQVDVFSAIPFAGNPVAVVLDAEGLSTDQMQRFASWTNLSETTFVLPPDSEEADYRVRIFTTDAELPFAGHPTIGTCHAWLEAGGSPRDDRTVVQQCEAGLITLRRDGPRLAFAAPPLIRSGPVSDDDVARACALLQVDPSEIVAASWADNGPGWLALQLDSAESVLSLTPDWAASDGHGVGVLGPHPLGVVGPIGKLGASTDEPAIEVRAFFRSGERPAEDPVTGSLNAALAQWLLGNGTLDSPYVASQGTAIGRAGRVHVAERDGNIWVGGDAVTCVKGSVEI